jgi:hypothetical protein
MVSGRSARRGVRDPHVGGGKPALPDRIRLDLELLDHRRFTNGTVHLQYRVTSRAELTVHP